MESSRLSSLQKNYRKWCCYAVLACAVSGVSLAQAQTSGEPSADAEPVAALGKLNGVALACQQQALANRIRDLIVSGAPKSREVGEVFETSTTEGFLLQGAEGAICPDGKTLAALIDEQAIVLKKRYPENP